MTANSNSFEANNFENDVYATAHEYIALAEEEAEEFTGNRLKWVEGILGITKEEVEKDTELTARFDTSHINVIVDSIPGIIAATSARKTPSSDELIQLKLFLAGIKDYRIEEMFDAKPHSLGQLRSRVSGNVRRYPTPASPRNEAALSEARKNAVEHVLGTVAVENTVQSPVQVVKQKTITEVYTRTRFEVLPSAFILQRAEERYIEAGYIPPEFEGQLIRHFLDTEKEMTIAERNAIGRSLTSFYKIVTHETATDGAWRYEPKLSEGISLIKVLTDTRKQLPKGRAVQLRSGLIKKYGQSSEIPEAGPESREAIIVAQNETLDVALSWIFRTKEKPAEPVSDPRAKSRRRAHSNQTDS